MRDWLLARLRGAGGGGSSSRRPMLSGAANEAQRDDEEKGAAGAENGTYNPKGKRLRVGRKLPFRVPQ